MGELAKTLNEYPSPPLLGEKVPKADETSSAQLFGAQTTEDEDSHPPVEWLGRDANNGGMAGRKV
ncbi:MAG TPA: hypothetical protein VGR95_07120, partial [Thermoanaerobaculia bacterium]|nr:hypothetical protein [Thermoanaerobaculia bacterium]